MKDPYFDIPRLSNSAMGDLKKCPAYFKWRQENPMGHKDAFDLGSLVHCIVLEPLEVEKRFAMFSTDARPEPDKTMASKLNKEWKAEFIKLNEFKIVMEQSEWNEAYAMSNSVRKAAGELLTNPENVFEKTILWERDGVEMKGKIDIWNPNFLVDIKTTRATNPGHFMREANFKYSYYRQAAVYLDGDANGFYSGEKPFYFITVENTAPYLSTVIEAGASVVAKGMVEYKELVALYKKCTKENNWPSYNEMYLWEIE